MHDHCYTQRTESFGKVTATGRRWLEEQAFVLLGAELYSDLTTEIGAITADNVVAIVFPHLMVDLVDVGHICGYWYKARR